MVSLDAIEDDIKRIANADRSAINQAVDSLLKKHLIKLEAIPNMFVLTQFGKTIIKRDIL